MLDAVPDPMATWALTNLAHEASRLVTSLRAAAEPAGRQWRGATRRWFDHAFDDVLHQVAGAGAGAAEEVAAGGHGIR